MSIDRMNLINQYIQGAGSGLTAFTVPEAGQADFEKVLRNILSENQKAESLESLLGKGRKAGSITAGEKLDSIFEEAAQTYDVPVELLKAVAKAESGFNPNAVSRCGAVGIMQLMPATAKALGVVDSYDPKQNIMGGASYLSQKLKAYDGDISLALAAYNAGSGNVAKYGGVPPFKETRNYINKVIGYMGEDIEIPDQQEGGKKSADGLSDLLAGANKFSDMSTEKAYYATQLQMIQNQMNMLEMLSGDGSGKTDGNSLEAARFMDLLGRL